jgi:hypothetical protein
VESIIASVISSVITGVLALVGTIITVKVSSNKTNAEINSNMRVMQAVTDTKLEELTREVREHNNFAKRMPVVEEQIKVINHRIDDLEHSEKMSRSDLK